MVLPGGQRYILDQIVCGQIYVGPFTKAVFDISAAADGADIIVAFPVAAVPADGQHIIQGDGSCDRVVFHMGINLRSQLLPQKVVDVAVYGKGPLQGGQRIVHMSYGVVGGLVLQYAVQ